MHIKPKVPDNSKPERDRTNRYRSLVFRVYQCLVFGICFLTILIDGFDTQAAAFAGPLLKDAIGGGSQMLGLIFGAGLLGGLVGGLLLGPLGDRVGRRPLILTALLIIALGSFATGFTHNGYQIAVFRFLTGLGLGGAVPSVIALSAEYSSARWRSTVVAIVFNGFPLGAVLGSVLAAYVLPLWGWRVLFEIGGVIPTLIFGVAALCLPESLQYLARSRQSGRLNVLMHRLGDSAEALMRDEKCHRASANRGSVARLFSGGFARVTVLVWIICFLSLLSVYFIVSWLPTIAAEAGLPLRTAVLAIAAINIGSVLGNVALARVADRRSPYLPTGISYVVGAIFIALIGIATTSSFLMLGMCFAAGVFCVGAQLSVTAIIARLYPTELRATGIGWSFGVGRLGGIIGPIAAGFLLGNGFGLSMLTVLAGMLSFLTGIAVLMLGRTRSSSNSDARVRTAATPRAPTKRRHLPCAGPMARDDEWER